MAGLTSVHRLLLRYQQDIAVKRFFHKVLGDRGENAAARFLRKAGYRIVARSYRNQFGEIDLIALDGDQIVFVEVKTRTSDRAGMPFEAVDRRKQRKLTNLAMAWLKKHERLHRRARFDVVSVIWAKGMKTPQINHFANAFDATD